MPDLVIAVQEGLGKEEFESIQKSIEETGVNVDIHQRADGGPYACLDWIMPTGFAVYLIKPYFETFLQKAAEDHYELLKRLTKRLYQKAIHPETEWKIVSVGGIEKETIFTMHFSVIHELEKDGKQLHLKLMFPKSCSVEYFEKSLSEFSKLQSELMNKGQADLLFDKLVEVDQGRYGAKIFWYNTDEKKLEFIDLIESSKNKAIIAKSFL